MKKDSLNAMDVSLWIDNPWKLYKQNQFVMFYINAGGAFKVVTEIIDKLGEISGYKTLYLGKDLKKAVDTYNKNI